MTWVILNKSNGKYVAWQRSRHSFTADIRKARLFRTIEAAKQESCGDESPVTVESQLNPN